MASTPEEHSPRLPAGTQVGRWRVEAWRGQGAYGAVYRAVAVDAEHSASVALKLALSPLEMRFEREAQLLSRLSHPSIPRLLERGVLRHASGAEHPFLVMEWVEGTPLYAWAQQHAPSHRRVCQLLAQLARALEALHRSSAVHRDVKGDNVLVRHADGRAVLIDFGSGHFQGAPRITWQALAPCTLAYLSAQACLFLIRCAREPDLYYAPTAADDLFALGVTAYRMVMGEYPPSMDVQPDGQGGWRVSSPDPRRLLENNPRVQPVLREWILRLLSDAPEVRGTAKELAEALEAEAQERVAQPLPVAVPAAEVAPPVAPAAASVGARQERPRGQGRARAWRPWLVLATMAVAAVLPWTVQQPVHVSPGHVSVGSPKEAEAQVPDAGTAAVGDTAPTEPQESTQPPLETASIAQDSPASVDPKQPRRQVSPDAKGRCPGRLQVAFKGGCWIEHSMPVEACVESGYELFKGKCYTPALEVPRKAVPTSGPTKER
jgi:predicted Ser/Thr protein kinase